MRAGVVLALAAGILAGCGDDDTNKPYFEFAGGGFVANYRTADVYYGFIARPVKAAPDGAVIEAEFEMPEGQAPEIVTVAAKSGQLQYQFRSPNMASLVKGHRYKVMLRLKDAKGLELAHYEHSFLAEADRSTVPDQPLVTGPGYKLNPEAAKDLGIPAQ